MSLVHARRRQLTVDALLSSVAVWLAQRAGSPLVGDVYCAVTASAFCALSFTSDPSRSGRLLGVHSEDGVLSLWLESFAGATKVSMADISPIQPSNRFDGPVPASTQPLTWSSPVSMSTLIARRTFSTLQYPVWVEVSHRGIPYANPPNFLGTCRLGGGEFGS